MSVDIIPELSKASQDGAEGVLHELDEQIRHLQAKSHILKVVSFVDRLNQLVASDIASLGVAYIKLKMACEEDEKTKCINLYLFRENPSGSLSSAYNVLMASDSKPLFCNVINACQKLRYIPADMLGEICEDKHIDGFLLSLKDYEAQKLEKALLSPPLELSLAHGRLHLILPNNQSTRINNKI